MQNAKVRALGSPRARSNSVASRTLCMLKVRAVARHSYGVLICAQWELRSSAVRSPKAHQERRGRHTDTAVGVGACMETSWSPWRSHCVSTASLWRVYEVCTALARSAIDSISLPQRLHGALRSYSAPAAFIGVCTEFVRRCQCVLRKPHTNGINAAS